MDGHGGLGTGASGPGFAATIGLVVAAPERGFEAVGRRSRTWWQPLLLIAVANTLFLHAIYDRVLIPGELEALGGRGLGAEEMARGAEMIQGGMARTAAYAGTLILTPVGALLGAAFAYLLAAFLFGGSGSFVQTLAAVSYALSIGLIEHSIRLPVMLARRTLDVHFGPALVLDPSNPRGFVYHLAAQIDVFTIWKVVLAAFGVAVVHQVGRGRMIGAALGVWALWALAAAGVSAALGV